MTSIGVAVLAPLSLMKLLGPLSWSPPHTHSLVAAQLPPWEGLLQKASPSIIGGLEASGTFKNHGFHSETDLGSGSRLSLVVGSSLFNPASPSAYRLGMH